MVHGLKAIVVAFAHVDRHKPPPLVPPKLDGRSARFSLKHSNVAVNLSNSRKTPEPLSNVVARPPFLNGICRAISGKGEGRLPVSILARVITHLDRDRQLPNQRPSRV